MAWRQLCIWLVLLVQFQVYGTLGCLEEEHIALLQLKASFNYSEKHVVPPLWDEKDCCDWKGVECSNTTGRAIHLSLSLVWYKDYLNASLFLPFTKLRSLDLSFNRLLGCVWNGGFERLSRLTKLESLFLDDNYFNNTILPSLSTISTLKHLSLSYTRLQGSAHIQGLCKLKSLQELEIQENELQGILPPCLIDLTFLHVLDISSNQFVGSIALSPIANLTSLESLSFSANNFHSPIQFSTFANHSKLKELALDCDYNGTIVETEYPTWVPRFQLKSFVFSKCLANNLTPTIPSFLYSQYDLREIVLFGNNLKGEFPTWLLENNTKLERIILRNNSFTGRLQLPQNLNMKSLDVSQNHFHDQIPDNIGTLFPNLGELNMSRNAFEGSIPSSFGDLSSLERLDISNNNISGRIPANLVMGCSSLLVLKLSNNSLHGEIFPSSFNLTKLMILSFNDNHFIGEIPKSLSNCSDLGILDISNNRLSGSLPRWMGNMSSLFGIDMAKNNLEGSIPNDFCQLVYLKFLNLADNNLSGLIPSCFSPLQLEYVNFQRNKLTGTMTYAFSKSLWLVTLDVRDNYLAGSIPNWISKLLRLRILLLKGNHFQGCIPNDLCHSSNVKIMDLSSNYLSGPIPSCLNNITFTTERAKEVDPLESKRTFLSLYYGEIAYDFFTMLHEAVVQVEFTTKNMYYPYQGDILKLMSGIDLSFNQLTGRIPPEIGNISQIHALNLSHNHLTGPIPTTFSSLSQVESLDLSYNNLTGKIPSQLTRLSSLEVFNVAYNNLFGRVPDMIRQFATFKESSYEGNPLLCGPPLQKNCSTEDTANGKTSVRENDGPIDMVTFYASFTAAYITFLLGIFIIFYINPYWRQLWFHHAVLCITSCYYFIIDNLP